MKKNKNEMLRNLPSIDSLLQSEKGQYLVEKFTLGVAKFAIRQYLSELRTQILNDEIKIVLETIALLEEVNLRLIRLTEPSGRRVVNATGILLHTGLGRAPFADSAIQELNTFNGYSLLQTSLEDGKRSLREEKIEAMLQELTGCEAVTVINNNAEATMLVLNTLAKNKEAIISRGQLVEIGGSFRIPDVMEQSQAIMREIGTTNKTHIKDYRNAVNNNTGAIMHVHTSNYRIRGFSSTPDIKKICEFRKKEFPNIPVIDDIGSGALIPLSQFALPDEPLIKDSISAGSDIVCFSGDKLISGPQCGIICGRKEIIQKIRKNPFARMFRVDKMLLAVLEATLLQFISEEYKNTIPFYKMLSKPLSTLQQDGNLIMQKLKSMKNCTITVEDDLAYIGSGSNPDQGIPSKIIRITPNNKQSIEPLVKELRIGIPSVFCRINKDSIVCDLRTLLNNDIDVLISKILKLEKFMS